jgi:hypothetical protein
VVGVIRCLGGFGHSRSETLGGFWFLPDFQRMDGVDVVGQKKLRKLGKGVENP